MGIIWEVIKMIECPTCDILFEAKNGNQKYCTNKCKRSKKYKCAQCDKSIIQYKDNRGSIRFCTKMCSTLYAGSSVIVGCKQCGDEFTTKASAISYGAGKYCSNKCQYKSMETSADETCPHCDKVFSTAVNKHDEVVFCCKECFHQSMMLGLPKVKLYEYYITEQKTTREIALIYGTDKKVICDYLHKYGIAVRPNVFPSKNIIVCKNGLKVRSHYERAFVNEMLTQGMEFTYEPRLPFNKRYAADFKVESIYVEVWGMIEWDKYVIQMNKKKGFYKEYNLDLFSVYPDDFKNVRSKVLELKRYVS